MVNWDDALGILRFAVADIEKPDPASLLDIGGHQACDLVTSTAGERSNERAPGEGGCGRVLLWPDLKLGISEQRGEFVIRERFIVNPCNALETLSFEGISIRLLAPNGALIDRGEQRGV